MVSSKTIRFYALHQVIEHMILDSITHAKDKAFFSEGWKSCDVQPFLDCRQLLPELAAYHLIGDGILAPSDIAVFRQSARVYDQRGRKRKGTVAYKLVVSASDRVQGYLCAVDDRGLRIDLCRIVHWHCLRTTVATWDSDFVVGQKGRRAKSPLGAYLLTAPHWDTARFHTEILFAVYGPDNRRRIRGVRSDSALISALASRHAAGFEEPDFKNEPENLRWNSILAMQLEVELLEMCRTFYRIHGLDFDAAERKTAWLQTEGRSERGKALAERRNSPALRYKSPEAKSEPSSVSTATPEVSPEAGAVRIEVVGVPPIHAGTDAAGPVAETPVANLDDAGAFYADASPSLRSATSPLPALPENSERESKGAVKLPSSRREDEESRAQRNQAASVSSAVADVSSSPSSAVVEKREQVPTAHLPQILIDVFSVGRGESRDELSRPAYWIDAEQGLDLSPELLKLLEVDDSEESKEILKKRKLMLKLQTERKEAERQRAERDQEMSR